MHSTIRKQRANEKTRLSTCNRFLLAKEQGPITLSQHGVLENSLINLPCHSILDQAVTYTTLDLQQTRETRKHEQR
jgi:hypothetical protein